MGISPALISAGVIQLRWPTIFAVLALLAVLALSIRLSEPLRPRLTSVLAPITIALIGGMAVGRMAVLLEHPEIFRRGVLAPLLLTQGALSLPAAALGGAGVLTFWAALFRKPVWAVLGIAGPLLLLAVGIASIGLVISGDFVGQPADVAWALVYTRPDSGVPATLVGRPVLALAAYAAVWSVVSFGALWSGWEALRPGERLFFAALAFGLGHWVLGYFRLENVWLLGLRQDQLLGLVWVVIGGGGLIFGSRGTRAAARQVRGPSTS